MPHAATVAFAMDSPTTEQIASYLAVLRQVMGLDVPTLATRARRRSLAEQRPAPALERLPRPKYKLAALRQIVGLDILGCASLVSFSSAARRRSVPRSS
jgi:hypothetical protein